LETYKRQEKVMNNSFEVLKRTAEDISDEEKAP